MSQSSIEARTILALQALQNNTHLSIRRAAKSYQVPRTRLRRRLKGIPSISNISPKSRKLSDLEEQTIAEYILDLDSRGFPPRLLSVEEMANQLLAKREEQPVGKRWAFNFVKRHPQLQMRSFRKYDYKRAKCEDPALIRQWFLLVENTIAKYGIGSNDLYNFDETGFLMGIIGSGMVVTGAERRGNPKSIQPGSREWVTAIQAINAEGWAIPPFIIVAGQYHLATWYQDHNLPGDWAISTTQNGWTNDETGLEWLKHFDHHTGPRSVGQYRLLVLDGHGSHHTTDFELYCKEHKIITLCMPPHSSHLLQPLDVSCFGPLKQAYGKQIEHLIRSSITHISKTEFLPAFYTAFKASLTEKNIKGGFRGAGLVPLDPEVVVSKLDVRIQTPTPAEEEPSLPDPWVSATPKTASEARSQTEYLKRRIRRLQSSSPASILDALTSLSKGAEVIMHRMALLESEIRDLRQANETLSRRRRAKRTRLQNKGKMTIQEGRDAIDQMVPDMLGEAEFPENRGQEREAQLRERRCGLCRKTGHNARTCQIVVEISDDEDSDESELIE